ncbi:MAG: exo-alpha-sialidase [Clostridia bacterium]|nr:exo-alpha-sialidase [Clostridia bacterium]
MLQVRTHQLVISVPKTLAHHASTLLPLPDGRVLVAWFGGSRESSNDVSIWLSEKTQDRFSEPRCIASSMEPHWNPVLFERQDGSILLFYKVGFPIPEWRTEVIESCDGGHTWSEPRELVPGDRCGGRGPVRNKPLSLPGGRIVAPSSLEKGLWRCFMDLSDDDGRTWHQSQFIEARGTHDLHEGLLHWQKVAMDSYLSGKPFDPSSVPPEYAHGRGVIQPTLWMDQYGLHALLRSGEGYIYRTDSADSGETWCEAYPTSIPNNNSGIDLTMLPGGELILCYNPVGGNFSARSPISLAISRDLGENWEKICDLETEPDEFSYPAIVSRGNHVYLTYTYRRQNIAYWEFDWLP